MVYYIYRGKCVFAVKSFVTHDTYGCENSIYKRMAISDTFDKGFRYTNWNVRSIII